MKKNELNIYLNGAEVGIFDMEQKIYLRWCRKYISWCAVRNIKDGVGEKKVKLKVH